MTRWLPVIAAAVLLIAGCSSSAKPHVRASTPPGDASFLAAIHAQTIDPTLYTDVSDDRLLSAAHEACSLLAHPSNAPYGPANNMIGQGWLADQVAGIVHYAQLDMCPNAAPTP